MEEETAAQEETAAPMETSEETEKSESTSTRLFIGGLTRRGEREIKKDEITEEFKEFGEIVDVWVGERDPPTGFAFVEYATMESATAAIAAKHNTECFGCKIVVELSKKTQEKAIEEKAGLSRIYIGHIKDAVEEKDIREVYEEFGVITDIWIAENPPRFAFVGFEDADVTQRAIEETNGTELFGGVIKVEISKLSPKEAEKRNKDRANKREKRDNRDSRLRGRVPRMSTMPIRRRMPYYGPPMMDPYGRRRALPPRPYAHHPYAVDPYYGEDLYYDYYDSYDAFYRDPYANPPPYGAPRGARGRAFVRRRLPRVR